ncbi:DNA cross-link repair 1A protein [Operophtera brumata]|uniref:DNA cross-link repair 1A protein n=1 Tax=Operophtera brumata TaxID=104452 RepID=A0A0L7KXU6_OPEBR|nr:DNA cross-link repair 1A protein [Operophtera brumata]
MVEAKENNEANKENTPNLNPESQILTENVTQATTLSGNDSLGLYSFGNSQYDKETTHVNVDNREIVKMVEAKENNDDKNHESFTTGSSETEFNEVEADNESTVHTSANKTIVNVLFEIDHCETVDVTARNSVMKRFRIAHKDASTIVDCEVLDTSQISTETEVDENMNETSSIPRKRSAVAVSLEIKKQKLSATDRTENSKVLILNTNAIEKISHVIVQPSNYKFKKRNTYRNKSKSCSADNDTSTGIENKSIDSVFRQTHVDVESNIGSDKWEDAEEMSRNSGVIDAGKYEQIARTAKLSRRDSNEGTKSAKLPSKRDAYSPKRTDIKTSNSEAPSPRVGSSLSPRKNAESIHFSLPSKTKTNKTPSLCPGALMLVFTLPNGKTLLHTGDFRAWPPMESYPVFWNRDIHTIYLDTTYCNPRYDFPTQDQSLEMALHILRQKKMVLEKAGKKFASEKFFLGLSRRVGCSVWACPEKERVLQTVEGKACSRDAPQACQLHVKLRCYLDSLQGAFSEVVAFKPSGWENGKNSCVERDSPKQVVPIVDISGGVKTIQKYFPCPFVYKDEIECQSKVTDYFSIQNRLQAAAVT